MKARVVAESDWTTGFGSMDSEARTKGKSSRGKSPWPRFWCKSFFDDGWTSWLRSEAVLAEAVLAEKVIERLCLLVFWFESDSCRVIEIWEAFSLLSFR